WKSILPPANQWQQLASAFPAVEAHLASVARVAEVSRLLAGRLDMAALGRATGASEEASEKAGKRFGSLTSAYGRFYESASSSEEALLSLPPALTAHPAAEYFNAVDLLETTTGSPVEPELEEEREATRAELARETTDVLTAGLSGR